MTREAGPTQVEKMQLRPVTVALPVFEASSTTSDYRPDDLDEALRNSIFGDLPAEIRLTLFEPHEPESSATDADILVMPVSPPSVIERVLASIRPVRVILAVSTGVEWLLPYVPPEVIVCTGRGGQTVAVAEWVIGAVLATLKKIPLYSRVRGLDELPPRQLEDLAGKTVVILGYGSIGAAVEARLRPFDVQIVRVASTTRPGVIGVAELDDALRAADVLVGLLPHTAATEGLIDRRRLRLLRKGTLIVNAGRGPTIDAGALLDELVSGRLRTVLDVTDPEPLPKGHPLLGLPNVLLTHHSSSWTPGTRERAWRLVREQVLRFARGEELMNRVGQGY